MAEQTTRTTRGDAPLSAAKKPDPRAVAGPGANVEKDDQLVGRTVSINRPRGELYAFWRDFTNLTRFMENIEAISVLDERRSHWVVTAPGDRTVEWDSVVTEDEPGSLIAWASVKGADVRNSGRVEFRDSSNGRGTVVTVTIVYDPPGGTVGKALAKLLQREPNIQARRDLRRFKQLMETGEVATAQPPEAAPRGR
ncbi:MAG: cyclase [Gammaproteobacteria bacterium]|jgi:uncharacterized membrane protein|nr:cyclase [Gammaproteobacteria bacterium]